MARKSLKQITQSFNTIAENYFKAANAKGLSQGVRDDLTNRWAYAREVAYILATNGKGSSLDQLVEQSAGWVKSAEAVAAEAAK